MEDNPTDSPTGSKNPFGGINPVGTPVKSFASIAASTPNNAAGQGSVKRARGSPATLRRLRMATEVVSDDEEEAISRPFLSDSEEENSDVDSADEDEDDTSSGSAHLKRSRADSTRGSTIVSLDAPVAEEGDDFLSLLRNFARLDMPDFYSKEEACPLCGIVFPTEAFADHVYECIRCLDTVEHEHVAAIDRKVAEKIAMDAALTSFALRPSDGMGDEAVDKEAVLRQQEELMATAQRRRAQKPPCERGAACAATDSAHFLKYSHPPACCPLCDLSLPMYEVNAHVSTCITTPEHLRLGVQQRTQRERERQELRAAQHGYRDRGQEEEEEEEGMGMGVRGRGARGGALGSDSDSDEEESSSTGTVAGTGTGTGADADAAALAARLSSASAMGASGAATGTGTGTGTGAGLSVGQLGALARMVVAKVDAATGATATNTANGSALLGSATGTGMGTGTGTGADEVNLASLLSTFRGLGLTREAVEEATKRLQGE